MVEGAEYIDYERTFLTNVSPVQVVGFNSSSIGTS